MERKSDKTDRRIIKTKKAIRNAFAELLSEKKPSEITVKDIADTADVNRKTVYNYYSGIHQIINEIENEIIGAFEDVLRDVDFVQALQNPYIIFQDLTAIINSDMDFYSHLMKMDSNSSLVVKIVSALKAMIKKSVLSQIDVNEQKFDLVLDYAVSGMLAVYQNWFNSDRTESIERISEMVSAMTFTGANGLLEIDQQANRSQ